ncbi:anti-sigma regulatory factor [Mycoplasmatota bacterium WC44]
MKYKIKSQDLSEAGIIASTIKKKLRQLNISNSVVRKVAIAVYEAEINVVIHSRGGDAEVFLSDGYIKIIFTDFGPGIDDIPAALSEGWSTASDYARGNGFGAGMGLPNIKALADEFNLMSSPGGTILKIGFNLE